MSLDWELINRVAAYYEFSGGSLGRDFCEFRRGGIADYYDEGNRQIGEQRLMPLVRNYLRYGISRSDRKEVGALLDFLVDLTKKPNTKLRRYDGSREMKKYLLKGEGGSNIMERNYDNCWFIRSLDNVIEGLRVSVNYLTSLKEGLTMDSARSDADVLIGRYEALIGRVEALKDAPPETQTAVTEELKPVIAELTREHNENLRLRHLSPSLSGPGEQNVFNRIEPKLKSAESAAVTLRRGSKRPNADGVAAATISRGNWEELQALADVRQYRALCNALKAEIEETLRRKEEYLNRERTSSDLTDRMIEEKQAAKKKLEEKAAKLALDYENGLIDDKAISAEADSIESEMMDLEDALEDLYEVKRNRPTDNLATEKAFFEQTRLYWDRICVCFGGLLEDTTSDRRMVEHFEGISAGLRTFAAYLNDFDDNGHSLDLNGLNATMESITE
ncbi:MAG: hypothetical protein IJT69_02945, partial [Clostridia bacterium]|nr:hypothetical protein [Clostridia bacterium]